MPPSKPTIVTFKAEPSLVDALRGVPNRSAFIRSAVLQALENACPLCQGTGLLTPEQRTHWETFAQNHTVAECDRCHKWHLVCQRDDNGQNVHVDERNHEPE